MQKSYYKTTLKTWRVIKLDRYEKYEEKYRDNKILNFLSYDKIKYMKSMGIKMSI
jgi:hypothetical protein